MTVYTNLSQNLNLTSFDALLRSANSTTGDWFWTAVYWMIMVVVAILSLSFGFEIAVLMAFFTGFVVGWFLLYLGLINIITFGMSEAIMLFMVIYLIYSSNKNN